MRENGQPKIRLDASKTVLDMTEAPAIQGRRMAGLLSLSLGVNVMLALALLAAVPLKERVPYFLEVERSTGRVEVSNTEAMRFSPDDANIRYFLRQWVIDTYTIDEATRSKRLPASYSLLRGGAVAQWERLILQGEDPIGKLSKNPAYRRNVEIVAPPQIVADGSAIMRIALVEGRSVVARKQVSVRFALIPPKDDKEIMRSPIGLWITDLGVVDESL